MNKGRVALSVLFVATALVGGFLLSRVATAEAKPPEGEKVYICHCEPQKKCVTLHIAPPAARRHLAEHKDDYRGRCVEPTPTTEPTKRWCFPCENGDKLQVENGIHKWCAEAIPQSKDPDIGFPWEEGMDKWCEKPEVCETEKWSCEACQNDPRQYEERLGICYEKIVNYCGDAHGCGWEQVCPENDLVTLKAELCKRVWVCEDTCDEPEPTPDPEPTPTEEPKQESTTSTPSKPSAPQCKDWVPGGVANIYVDRGTPNDGALEVRWLSDEPIGPEAHIRYTDGDPGDWRYALLNTPNDGVETISGLKNGQHYWFSVAQVNGCAVGTWSGAYDPLP